MPVFLIGSSVGGAFWINNYFYKKWPKNSLGIKVWFDRSYINELLVGGNWIASDFFDRNDSSFFKKEKSDKSFKLIQKDLSDSELPSSLNIPSNETANRNFWSKNFVITGLNCKEVESKLDEYYRFRTKSKENEVDNGLEKLWLKDGKIFYKTGYRSPFGILPVTLIAGGFKCISF
ncbi:hypothetical protein [Mycoplasma parvum]|uniref:hypothetical protein n=1 Tax=Mycoplasma parvum TaxID=984991 RepID=UPI001F38A6F8|nr:hypothetical protein [Mycoplasma parvum]